MQSEKHDVEELLRKLPGDSTYEDIQYHLFVLEKIRRGEARAEQEATLTQAQTEARLSKWRTS